MLMQKLSSKNALTLLMHSKILYYWSKSTDSLRLPFGDAPGDVLFYVAIHFLGRRKACPYYILNTFPIKFVGAQYTLHIY